MAAAVVVRDQLPKMAWKGIKKIVTVEYRPNMWSSERVGPAQSLCSHGHSMTAICLSVSLQLRAKVDVSFAGQTVCLLCDIEWRFLRGGLQTQKVGITGL